MRRREKLFGPGRAVPLDRNAKARILAYARAWGARHRQPGQHRGPITRAFLEVLEALLWGFHNARSGCCFPSYETIAEKAECARSVVAEALKVLELAGVLTWQHRIARIQVRERDLFGRMASRWRVIRTSNAYVFRDPQQRLAGRASFQVRKSGGNTEPRDSNHLPQRRQSTRIARSSAPWLGSGPPSKKDCSRTGAAGRFLPPDTGQRPFGNADALICSRQWLWRGGRKVRDWIYEAKFLSPLLRDHLPDRRSSRGWCMARSPQQCKQRDRYQHSATPMSEIDVERILSGLASQKGGGGNWRTSIVDLLKLLDLDSSLTARKQLANELNVHEGADGSAEENIALHHAVMQKLEENGGKVPDSLKG